MDQIDGGDPPRAPLTRRMVILAGLGLMVGGCANRRYGAADPVAPPVARRPDPLLPAAPPPTVPAAPATGLRIVPRSAWTREAVGANSDPMGPIERITLHHTGEHLSSSGIPDRELIKRIEHHHRANLGWAAIGYHYLSGKDGTIYEGRPAAYQGAHCGGDNNRRNLGVTMIGEFDRQLPSAPQLASLVALLADQRGRRRIPARAVFGHRDLKNTVCPGERLYAWLRSYRASAS